MRFLELLQKWGGLEAAGVSKRNESAGPFVVADALGCRCGSRPRCIWESGEREGGAGLEYE